MLREPKLDSRNIDLEVPYETERKFLPLYPEQFTAMRRDESTIPIEQVYLSSPDEPFNLRLRELVDPDGRLGYEATLKDRGQVELDGLRRIEVTAPISPELYAYYKTEFTPVLQKLRAEPIPKVVVDFYEDGSVQIESEDEEQWRIFTSMYGTDFIEITGSHEGDNERRAHDAHRLIHSNNYLVADHEVVTGSIIQDVLSARSEATLPLAVHVGGRSGSGKSTVVRELAAGFEAFGITSSTLSTDDYHRGATWLATHNGGQPWRHWDDDIVYDTAAMAEDLEVLRAGQPIARREIDWKTVEPRLGSLVQPADIIIIEGIYATKPEVTEDSDLIYELKTPLATCIGRRLLRDIKERPQFADPAESLLYMLTEAEPAYRRQGS